MEYYVHVITFRVRVFYPLLSLVTDTVLYLCKNVPVFLTGKKWLNLL